MIARYNYFKLDDYRKECKLGIEIIEVRREEDVFPCFLTRSEVRWRDVGYHKGLPNAINARLLLQVNATNDKDISLMASFSSTPVMAGCTTTSQPPRRRSSSLFTIFHVKITRAPTSKPTRRSPLQE
jgi:hypothetical protein